MQILKKVLRKNKLILNSYRQIRNLYKLILGKRHPLQSHKNTYIPGLVRLGTDYGGWTFLETADLNGCTIISAGLGEDASFDVEFAQKYDARVIIVDPTPRSISHYDEIMLNLGRPRLKDYNDTGREDISSYNLSGIRSENLVLEPSALWTDTDELKFFLPANHSHISHSIINYQNDYKNDSEHITVNSTTLQNLIQKYNIDNIGQLKILKLDIEGAELEVLDQLIDLGIFPDQLLIEYDDLNAPKPNRKRFDKISRIHQRIIDGGYRLVYNKTLSGSDIAGSDFVYVKKELLPENA